MKMYKHGAGPGDHYMWIHIDHVGALGARGRISYGIVAKGSISAYDEYNCDRHWLECFSSRKVQL